MASSKTVEIKSPRKLIEVALPLDKINAACAHEKMPGIGAHPRGIHLWWARRPLAAARAVLFAQLVNDPGYERHLNRGVKKVEAAKERERLFKIIEDLVKWENTNNEGILETARNEIWNSWRETCELNRNYPDAAMIFNPEKLPAFHDPFAGGGAIPLEAQRLGLESFASDLNPIAVTINKAMIQIPPVFAGHAPMGPLSPGDRHPNLSRSDWVGTEGLAEDVRRYAAWMRTKAKERLGELYPKVTITSAMTTKRPDLKSVEGQSLTVVAWLWARTVKSPNPAFSHVDVPLVTSFVLSSKVNKEAYVEPVIEGDKYSFTIRLGKPPSAAANGTKLSRGANFECLLSKTAIPPSHIYAEAQAKRMGNRLMAIVVDGPSGRIYLSPLPEHEQIARSAKPDWEPSLQMSENPRWFSPPMYGLKSFGDIFTPRQLVALDTFTDLLQDAVRECEQAAIADGLPDDSIGLNDSGSGALAYAQAVGVYLAFVIDRCCDFSNTCTRWVASNEKVMNLYAKQAIGMTWDFPEANIIEDVVGGFFPAAEYVSKCINKLPQAKTPGDSSQADAATPNLLTNRIVSTDPPYFDNIGYADLSDFFYVWLRKSLRLIFPLLFSTLAVPKIEELVAIPYRHGGKEGAESFFLTGMGNAIKVLASESHPAFPISIYYAFKQSDTSTDDGTSSSGWETFIAAVLQAGLSIGGTWPIRSEQSSRMVGSGTNALASSIVLVCRKRDPNAPTISRREFLRELHAVLPDALVDMTRGGINSPVAPVDLSQAIIGPGMGIFSKYRSVLEADGTPMSVRTALQLINRFLADDDFDPQTQFCLQWFETNYWKPGQYGVADVAARAKGTSVDALFRAGVLNSGSGEVQLLRWNELPTDWKPDPDHQTPVWEALHQLIRNLNMHGEQSAGALLARMSTVSGPVRTLAYRLYTLCERKGLAEDARFYNELIGAWASIEVVADEIGPPEKQGELF
jgi:putative DNA methylase